MENQGCNSCSILVIISSIHDGKNRKGLTDDNLSVYSIICYEESKKSLILAML